jgi:hypothetical protein
VIVVVGSFSSFFSTALLNNPPTGAGLPKMYDVSFPVVDIGFASFLSSVLFNTD